MRRDRQRKKASPARFHLCLPMGQTRGGSRAWVSSAFSPKRLLRFHAEIVGPPLPLPWPALACPGTHPGVREPSVAKSNMYTYLRFQISAIELRMYATCKRETTRSNCGHDGCHVEITAEALIGRRIARGEAAVREPSINHTRRSPLLSSFGRLASSG